MKRRSFFQGLAKAAAIVALAPQLAFRVKPHPFELRPLIFKSNSIGVYEQLKEAGKLFEGTLVKMDPPDLREFFDAIYAIKRDRNDRVLDIYKTWML